jgi:GT2 family glycosyltransferase
MKETLDVLEEPRPADSQTGVRFSIVIVNYNGGTMLLECVLSALREGVPTSQIFVIDNNSHDDSIQILEIRVSGMLVIHKDRNMGFARAVNQGIVRASTEFVLLLNNDAQLEAGCLQAFSDGFDAMPKMAIAGGQLYYPGGQLQSSFAPFPTLTEELVPRAILRCIFPDRFRRKMSGDVPLAEESVFGACLCVRRSALPELGLLDEDFFFFFEEIEWCHRAWRMGKEVYYLPKARASHRQGQTANRFRGPSRIEYQRSKLIFFKKTRSSMVFLVLSGLMVFRALINAVSNALMCVATLCLNKRLRVKARTYGYVLCWHLWGRPAEWGLPGK